jgi:PPR repeat
MRRAAPSLLIRACRTHASVGVWPAARFLAYDASTERVMPSAPVSDFSSSVMYGSRSTRRPRGGSGRLGRSGGSGRSGGGGGSAGYGGGEAVSEARSRAAAANKRSASKRSAAMRLPPPPRETGTLYDAVVHRGAALEPTDPPIISDNVLVPIDPTQEAMYRERLASITREGDAFGAVALLNDMEDANLPPSPWTLLSALRACIPSGDIDRAEKCFERMLQSRSVTGHQRALSAARTSLALCYASRRCPDDVLRVLGWTTDAAERGIDALVDEMNFGKDVVSWSVLMWALIQRHNPTAALDIANALTARGVFMTDSMCHLSIEALGALGRVPEAESVLEKMMARGQQPHERTVGSLLRLLTRVPRRRSQPPVDPDRITELVNMVPEPSERFTASALHALATVGCIDEAESQFNRLSTVFRDGGLPDERACVALMRSYSVRLTQEVPDSIPDHLIAQWYADLDARADRLWERYVNACGDFPPTPEEAHARLTIFPKYILIKSIGLQQERASELLEAALEDDAVTMRPWFEPDSEHFSALLTGVEKSCNVAVLERALVAMTGAGIALDDACLAASIGTLVGHGDAIRAGKLTRACAAGLFNDETVRKSDGENPPAVHHRKRLVRRLELLIDALTQAAAVESATEVRNEIEELCHSSRTLALQIESRLENTVPAQSRAQPNRPRRRQ